MREEIIKILHNIEQSEDIEILYACEGGSRAWGFANDNSDYDIRFIYKKRNMKDYLTIRKPKDVIEVQGDNFDIIGWDVKKALVLHFKDNPSLREWLLSDRVYIDRGIESVFAGLGGFDKRKLKNHYMSMAKSNWKKYSTLEFSSQKTKKYLYVIRSILCWRLLNQDIYPPIRMDELLNHDHINLDDDIKCAIQSLIDYHQGKCNLDEYTILKLNYFILDSLSSMKASRAKSLKQFDDYDERFRELLMVCR